MIDLIPAIDLIGGKCVRLTRGDYSSKKEYGDPLDMAMQFEDHGVRRLHLVDLDGAKAGKVVNYRILEEIASKTRLVIDAGGGIKSDEDLRIIFDSGAAMATGGSIAVKEPEVFEQWIVAYGPEKIILGSDFSEGRIAVSGWTEATGEELMPFIGKWTGKGITRTICTDISKDGVLEGTSVNVYREILEQFPELYLVASGGVASLDDVELLVEAGVPAVIIGKAIYEGRIGLKELENFIQYKS
ncbi:MAG: 1-(5-phosphoribosyl)-5-[(5-phosphoribosylamino)methylideneamino] imidazole-4-carboxamide isomerase [Bacteroidales bacterium]|nr:1-(5-phosphoribosyl)-5-[(5-phosphoribosylamino)methylideneamino] imidazole-4-carboxamide isomerase [Bacteroidales bacterium]